MAINLEEHKVYVESHKMDMVPLSIVQAALKEISLESESKLDEAMNMIEKSLQNINSSIKNLTEE